MSTAIELIHVNKVFELTKDKSNSLKAAILSFKKRKRELVTAIKDLNLTISTGETVAVIGRNGSGKSTLLRLIGKVYKQSSGKIVVNGRMSTMLDLGAGIEPDLTGRENIYFNAAIMGIPSAKVDDRIDAIINFSELYDFIDAPAKTYSAGMLMRLGFAVSIETDPDILLIDEVLAVGDAAFQKKCYDRIHQFQNCGKTIVFVTHDLEAARKVASRAIWMQQGLIMADGKTDNVIDTYLKSISCDNYNDIHISDRGNDHEKDIIDTRP